MILCRPRTARPGRRSGRQLTAGRPATWLEKWAADLW